MNKNTNVEKSKKNRGKYSEFAAKTIKYKIRTTVYFLFLSPLFKFSYISKSI
jgi:hypothetical protein